MYQLFSIIATLSVVSAIPFPRYDFPTSSDFVTSEPLGTTSIDTGMFQILPPPLTFQQQSMSIPHINYPSYTLLKTLFPQTNSVSLLQPMRTPTSPLLPLSYPKKRPHPPPPAPAWTHHGMGKDLRGQDRVSGAQKRWMEPRSCGLLGGQGLSEAQGLGSTVDTEPEWG